MNSGFEFIPKAMVLLFYLSDISCYIEYRSIVSYKLQSPLGELASISMESSQKGFLWSILILLRGPCRNFSFPQAAQSQAVAKV